ncbi:Pimeloyl-ACP methyl ester carboxylesterase [Halopseudomonas xinjiangensis]|uniref:Pimeloyl-ACP methyl ester carboxylesterase n=1 Tax=Halopseudomonas xinjiangensis TaxID=487184 RepID=A0A1H1PEG3_9GAMM|nr:alpha/beta hydrolase [Halopseudomonas xinjiangensis]SDS09480.1 Pimeloyl-ACP methyl ester carboxylesterase [Halopseudomonas xinjiangensis]
MYSIEDVELQKWTVSGLDARVAVLGQGPVALCVHGWPECWYSWRHQMVLLANAGYRVIAPDMPGFGQTQGYAEIADYTIERTGRFLSDLIAEAGVSNVLLLGHDWGAINVWGFALQYPHKVSKMVVMSVPLKPLGEQPPTEQLRELFQDRFFYQLYFQQPGVAEAEFDADPEGILRALFCSPDTPRAKPVLGKSISEGGGWIGRLGKPLEQPGWLTDEAIAYYVKTYRQSGFAGGLHYYRNIDRNWRIMQRYADARIDCPVLFLSGEMDYATQRATAEHLVAQMIDRVPSLTVQVLPDKGHWLQGEATEEVNRALLRFVGVHGQ